MSNRGNGMKSVSVSVLLLAVLAAALHSQQAPAPAQAPPQAAPPQAPTQPIQGPPALPSGQTPPAINGQPTPNANGTYTITRTARIVILDMVVTDAKGNVVTDLKRDDFHVTEMNEPQTVLNFEPAGAHVTPPNAEINSTAELDAVAPRAPVNIILLDEFNTRFEDMA